LFVDGCTGPDASIERSCEARSAAVEHHTHRSKTLGNAGDP
jgi:hypothetical protein